MTPVHDRPPYRKDCIPNDRPTILPLEFFRLACCHFDFLKWQDADPSYPFF
jgi:hypothetical protein